MTGQPNIFEMLRNAGNGDEIVEAVDWWLRTDQIEQTVNYLAGDIKANSKKIANATEYLESCDAEASCVGRIRKATAELESACDAMVQDAMIRTSQAKMSKVASVSTIGASNQPPTPLPPREPRRPEAPSPELVDYAVKDFSEFLSKEVR